MADDSRNTANVRFLLPETLWLEPDYIEHARAISADLNNESQQWQAYLNGLALITFTAWLQERLPNHYAVHPWDHEWWDVSYLRVEEFKVCLIAVEQVLDEGVSIPNRVIEQPEFAAHFYVILEVLEEEEQVIIRGFLRYDELTTCANALVPSQADGDCFLPLSVLDSEINHLMVYIQYSNPGAIRLPATVAQPAKAASQSNIIQLSRWLQGVLDEGWQTLDSLINPEATLAWNTRHLSSGMRGGKLINFGMQLGDQSVVLLVTSTPEQEGKIGVNIQVLPASGVRTLPAHLKLTLLSATDKILQEVQSREQDNYIQLKPFKGKPGTGFSIEVSLQHVRVREAFEL